MKEGTDVALGKEAAVKKQNRPELPENGNALAIVYVPIDSLKPAQYNPRIMPGEEMENLKGSIARFGVIDPVIVRRSDRSIIGGHQRYEAARPLAYEMVPAIFLDVTGEEAKILNVALNRIQGRWDTVRLACLLQELQTLPTPELELTGFLRAEASAIMRALDWSRRPSPDDIPEPPEAPTARHGDLWRLGDHVVLCGDCTDRDAVRPLLTAGPVNLVFTDPPYGVGYDPGARPGARARGRKMEGDHLPDEDYGALLEMSLRIAFDAASPGAAAYIFHASTRAEPVLAAFRRAGWHLGACLIWVKPAPTFTRTDYHWAHEPMAYGWKRGGRHRWFGGRSESTVWHFGRENSLPDSSNRVRLHPAQKPVALVERAISNSSRPGDTVFDPFVGSGTTLVACERLARRCLGVEIDPHFVDVTIRRWEQGTGQRAELIEKREE